MYVPRYLWSDAVLFVCQLIGYPLLSRMIKFLFLDFILIQSCFPLCLEYLGVHILFRIWLQIWASYLLMLSNMYLLATLELKNGISALILCLENVFNYANVYIFRVPYFFSWASVMQLFLSPTLACMSYKG